MSNNTYLMITGKTQGLISAGCSTYSSIGNRFQSGHADQILVYSSQHDITREQNVNHHPIRITKPLDKSTPLLLVAISNNERIQCILDYYRTSQYGVQEKFLTIKLTDATIESISSTNPSTLPGGDAQPYETLSLRYETIDITHHMAGTSGYSLWIDRVL